MSYATLAQFKAAVAIDDSDDDIALTRALEAATDWIEGYTGRVFGPFGSPGEARIYDPKDPWHLTIPDVSAVTQVAIDTRQDGSFVTILNAAQYQLYPLDIGQPGVNGNYRAIQMRPTAVQGFWEGRQVRVTGTWGYGTTPDAVVEACILLANRFFRRSAAPFGIISAPESGEFARLPQNDPDVRNLLAPFVSPVQQWVLV